MGLQVTDSSKNSRPEPCSNCGGSFCWDDEDREWRCLNCGRRPGAKGNSQTKPTEKIPAVQSVSKRRRLFVPPEGHINIHQAHSPDGNWWSPGQIRFTRKQAIFLVRNLPDLREGRWPTDPTGSGYFDLPIIKKGRLPHRANFEIPCDYAAEIEMRLEKAGLDGLILEAIEGWEKSEESLANYIGVSERTIRRRKKRALAYVASGPDFRWHDTKKRKGQSYEEFKRDKKAKRS